MRLYPLVLIFVISMLITSCASIVHPTVTIVSTPTPIVVSAVASHVVKPTPIPEPAPTVPALAYSEQDLQCMTENLWYESRGEGDVGMVAVGYVTLNRSRAKGFPSTICGVVHHRTSVKGRTFCQFAWVCNKPVIKNWSQYDHVREIARHVLEGSIHNPVGNSLYFHERSYRPRFAKASNYVATIGNHRFYTAP